MRFGRLSRAPRRLLMLFLTVTVVPAAALGWLSWRLLQQDRELESQRMRDKLDHAADLVVSGLDRRLVEVDEQLGKSGESFPSLPDDAFIVTFSSEGIRVRPNGRLLYYPALQSSAKEPPAATFESGEAFEYLHNDYARAIGAFRELSRSKDPSTRGGALIRLARNLRKSGRAEEALHVYDELERLGPVSVGGTPADLLAREARCAILAALGGKGDLEREALALNADFERGRWQLDRASYFFHSQEARRWLPPEFQSKSPPANALALAAGVEWLWTEWGQMRRDQRSSSGRHGLWAHDAPVLVVWHASGENLTGLVAGRRYMELQWRNAWADNGVEILLSDVEGHEVLGRPPPAGTLAAARSAADTRLPWTVRVTSANPSADFSQIAGRRRLLLAGLAMMAVLTILGGYFTTRAAVREFAVARLQSDFVSAVSHEFRTPLTSLRHLTELLADGTVTSEDRRRQYFAVLARETERLHRLVEGLLDFGRMEASGREYSFEAIDPVELIQNVVAEFRSDIEPSAHRVELTTNGLGPHSSVVRANREALTHAIRNLLENAVKYSPESPAVQVGLVLEGNRVAIRIHDDGFGIPAAEQKMIFEKFVRGSASKALHVQGTGIGLAMAQHIVRAHRGEILLESEPGRGTTFTIQLPAKNHEEKG